MYSGEGDSMKSHKVLALAFAFSLISFAEEQVESEARREEDRALSQIGTVDPLRAALSLA